MNANNLDIYFLLKKGMTVTSLELRFEPTTFVSGSQDLPRNLSIVSSKLEIVLVSWTQGVVGSSLWSSSFIN